MNETNLASIVLGLVIGFYSSIFLLCLSDVVYLNKEMTKMKNELADMRNIYSYHIQHNQTNSVDSSIIENHTLKFNLEKTIAGQLCLSYSEQRQILDYINLICNLAIVSFGAYSIHLYGLGTQHGLGYRLIFFLFKILTVLASIWLNLHFKQGLPEDIFLYTWIDINCIVSIYRSLRQTI